MAYKGQTKYKETMPAQLIEMFSRGEDREDFCALHVISYATFDIWLQHQSEFAEAYEVAKVKAKTWFNKLARDHLINEHEGPKLDSKLWSMLMRNRFELTEHRKLKMLGLDKAKSPVDQVKIVMSEHTTELLIDYLNLMMKKVRFQYEDQLKKDEDQLKQEALESLLFEQE